MANVTAAATAAAAAAPASADGDREHTSRNGRSPDAPHYTGGHEHYNQHKPDRSYVPHPPAYPSEPSVSGVQMYATAGSSLGVTVNGNDTDATGVFDQVDFNSFGECRLLISNDITVEQQCAITHIAELSTLVINRVAEAVSCSRLLFIASLCQQLCVLLAQGWSCTVMCSSDSRMGPLRNIPRALLHS